MSDEREAMERAEPPLTNVSLQRPAFQAGWHAGVAFSESSREAAEAEVDDQRERADYNMQERDRAEENAETAEAERDKARDDLARMMPDDTSVLIPVSALDAVGKRAEAAEAERDSFRNLMAASRATTAADVREYFERVVREKGDEVDRQTSLGTMLPVFQVLAAECVTRAEAAEAELERLRPCLENALQAMSSVAGRLRVEAKADDPDMEVIERDANLLAALCPPTRAALSPREDA